MRYRIELSTTRRGAARIHLPGRTFVLETRRLAAAEWEVSVSDPAAARSGTLAVHAASANDAVWQVARAAVRAIAELTGQPFETPPGGRGCCERAIAGITVGPHGPADSLKRT